MTITVQELDDDAPIVPFLQRDPRWSAYSLADLEPPYRQNARFIGAVEADQLISLLLLYRLPGAVALHTTGHPSGLTAILHQTTDLPPHPFLLVPEHHLPAIQTRYHITDRWLMRRMTLEPSALAPPPHTPFSLTRLDESHIPLLENLYHLWPGVFFDPLMLRSGVFYGALDAGRLVAVAGTHIVSPRFRLAAVGGVFTHPDYRGRRLARATTGKVCRSLTDHGIDLIVLNVRDGNLPAITTYQRLGFVDYLPYWEGHAKLR
jgi:ribosomal protein S18 acetylase RimI-like enzyme